MSETLDIIQKTIESGKSIHQTAVNASILVDIQKDEELYESVVNSDLINADGQSIVWASKFLRKPLKERVTGIDLMQNCIEMAHKNKFKVYFFGAKEEVVQKVVEVYSKKYSQNIVAGYRNGYFEKSEEKKIAEEISKSKANMLFVAITSPIKEKFLYENREILRNVNFTMGVGGSFDVVSGFVKRAPLWMQKYGLEWFFRFIQEPKRMWKRYLIGNSKFIFLVFKEKLGLI